jgi:hypothetical protein
MAKPTSTTRKAIATKSEINPSFHEFGHYHSDER